MARKKRRRNFKWTHLHVALLGTMPDKKLAIVLKICPSTVSAERRKLKISRYKKVVEIPDEAISDLKSGMTGVDVANKHKIPLASVYDLCKDIGVKLKQGPPKGRDNKWRDPPEDLGKVPDSVIAERLGITRERVRQIRDMHNIKSCRDSNLEQIESRTDEIIDTYFSLKSIHETAEALGIHIHNIYRILKNNNIKKLSKPSKYENLHPLIINDYLDGMGTKKIGDKYGLYPQHVYRIVAKAGINRTMRSMRKYDHDSIIEDYKSGMSVAEVSKKHGCCVGLVTDILKKYGIKKRRHPRHERFRELSPDLIAAYKSGENMSSICRTYKVSRDAVRKLLDKNGYLN